MSFEEIKALIEEKKYAQALQAVGGYSVDFLAREAARELDDCLGKIPEESIEASSAACMAALQLDLRLGRSGAAARRYARLVALRDAKKEDSRERAAASQYLCLAGLVMPELDNAQMLLRLAVCSNECSGRYPLEAPPRISLTGGRPSILRGARDYSEWGKNHRAVASIIEPMLTVIHHEKGSHIKSPAVAELLYEFNDLNGATIEVAASLSSSLPEVVFAGLAQMIRIHRAGDTGQRRIDELFKNIDALLSSTGEERLLPAARALRARHAVLTGEREPVKEWLEGCELEEMDLCLADSYEWITKAQALTALGSYRDALGLLERVAYLLRSEYRPLDLIECLCLSAVTCELLGDRGMALDKLSEALELAAQYRYIRVIADCGPVMLRLLTALFKDADRKPELPERYLRAVAEATRQTSILFPRAFAPVNTGEEAPAAELTSMELQILHLLEEGKTNKEIGETLEIKLPTVKFHMANLFEKLDAANRTAAVKKAKDLRLLR